MKKIPAIALLIVAFTTASFVKLKHAENYTLNVNTSTLDWIGKKVTGQHNGSVKFSGGQLSNNHGLISGSFEMDMTTIDVLDLTGDMKGKLTGHLKSDDFFGVEKFPKSTFVITSITPKGEKDGGTLQSVKGNLTLKGITNEITFDAIMRYTPSNLMWTGSMSIDRTKYGIKFRSKAFFPDIGDKMVYDDFIINFSVVADKVQ